MRIFLAISILLFLIIVFGVQIYFFLNEGRLLSADLRFLQGKLDEARENLRTQEEEYNYLLNPENIEKELKARFNYKRRGEKVIIVVPPKATSTESRR